MPAVLSKFVKTEKLDIKEQILDIMDKYKPIYTYFRRSSKKQLSFEAQDTISQFKMEIMALGLPKEVAEALHGRMMS